MPANPHGGGNSFLQAEVIRAGQQYLPDVIRQFYADLARKSDAGSRLRCGPVCTWTELDASTSRVDQQLARAIEAWTTRFAWSGAPTWFLEHLTDRAFKAARGDLARPDIHHWLHGLCEIPTRWEAGGQPDEVETVSFDDAPVLRHDERFPDAPALHATWFTLRVLGNWTYEQIAAWERQSRGKGGDGASGRVSTATIKDAVRKFAPRVGVTLQRGPPCRTILKQIKHNRKGRSD